MERSLKRFFTPIGTKLWFLLGIGGTGGWCSALCRVSDAVFACRKRSAHGDLHGSATRNAGFPARGRAGLAGSYRELRKVIRKLPKY